MPSTCSVSGTNGFSGCARDFASNTGWSSGPWIMGDELQYSDIAKSFAANGTFRVRDQPTSIFSLYPVLISPAWWASSMHTTYGLAKSINVLLMTSTAVPFYLWARRLVAPV